MYLLSPLKQIVITLTLKGPGFFVYFMAGGGGGPIPPPPSDLGRGAPKNSEIWHVRRVSQYERAIITLFNNLCIYMEL